MSDGKYFTTTQVGERLGVTGVTVLRVRTREAQGSSAEKRLANL